MVLLPWRCASVDRGPRGLPEDLPGADHVIVNFLYHHQVPVVGLRESREHAQIAIPDDNYINPGDVIRVGNTCRSLNHDNHQHVVVHRL